MLQAIAIVWCFLACFSNLLFGSRVAASVRNQIPASLSYEVLDCDDHQIDKFIECRTCEQNPTKTL